MKITESRLRRIIREALSREPLNESHPYDEAYIKAEKDPDANHISVMDNGNFLRKQMSEIDPSVLSPEMQAKLDELLTSKWFWDRDYKASYNLKKVPDEIKDQLDAENPEQIQRRVKSLSGASAKAVAAYKTQMEKDRAQIAGEKAHRLDTEINKSVDIGALSNSDAVDEIQARLEAMGENALVDEIEEMIEMGADNIVDVLAMIPKQIKDKLG